MRKQRNLSGYWQGRLILNTDIDVKAPEVIERDFYIPMSWNKQIEDLLWPGTEWREFNAIVNPIQNQNFRDIKRKYNEGTVVYSKDLFLDDLSENEGMAVFLVFEGSNYRTSVKVNGCEAGTHDGGHLPFEFDVTGLLRDGENALEIIVDNFRRKDACPQEQFNWQNYGGVYRPLYLEWRPIAYIQHYHVQSRREAGGWIAEIDIELSQPATATLDIEIRSGTEFQTISKDLSGEDFCRLIMRMKEPLVWQPGVGGTSFIQLFMKEDGKVFDHQTGKFGFREVALKDGRVHVNGQPVRLLGAAMHEQHPASGNSVSAMQARQDIKLLKNCGFNAVRTAHYAHARGLYDACDAEGILVVADLPCWQFNEHQFDSEYCLDLCCSFARETSRYLANHPSVIGYCIENESKVFAKGAKEFFATIAETFRDCDSDRLIICASQSEPPEHLAVVKKAKSASDVRPAPIIDVVDILGTNDYAGWYGEKAEYMGAMLDHLHARIPDKAMMVTEFGAESTPGERALTMEHYTEDYQSELICYHIREILKREYLAGFFLWLFIDYECSSIGISGVNRKGVVDLYRRPKLAYNEVKQLLLNYKQKN